MLSLSESRCTQDLVDRKSSLLTSLGVMGGDVEVEVTMGEEAQVTRQSGLPVPLSIIARIMCLTTEDELAVMCMTVDGQARTLSPENEVRAMRWIAGLLVQVQGQIFGVGSDVAFSQQEPVIDSRCGVRERRRILAAQVRWGEYHVLKCARDIALAASAKESIAGNPLATGSTKKNAPGKGPKKKSGKGFG